MTRVHPASVSVTLLGGVAVRHDDDAVHLPSARAVELLAYLTIHADTHHPRRHLAALLWPDSAEPQARTNLRRELHHLRALVPDGCLNVRPTSIGWVDHVDCTVDLRTFVRESDATRHAHQGRDAHEVVEHGRAGIAAYTGSFLPGQYDDWVLDARESLERTCVELCDHVVEALERRDVQAAKDVARRRIQLTPLEEVGYRSLMTLQVASGDRAGALTTYHRCASVLEEQFGVAPSSDTATLLRSLIEPANHGDTPRRPRAPQVRPARRAVVGRDADLADLLNRWQEARSGTPGLVLLTGDPGVGKSALLRELGRSVAGDGDVVAASRCFGRSAAALAPVADWLRAPEIARGIASLPAVWKAEVDRLVPPVEGSRATKATGLDPAQASRRAMVDSWQRHRFFEGLAHAITAVDRPLLLLLDDLHWADEETAAWITFLMPYTRGLPLQVVATARPDELLRRHDVSELFSELRSVGLVREVPLGPLGVADTTALASGIFGRPLDDEEARLLHTASAGHPLYVVEASQRSLARPGSRVSEVDLTGVLQQRLSEVSPHAQECAALAAAVGRDFRLELLVEASDLDEAEVVSSVDELWRRQLLRQVGHGYDFTHDLVREAAYQSLPPARRWLEHRRLAQALELLHAGTVDQVASALAEQYDRGGRPERAIPYYMTAAAGSAAVFATTEAIRLLRRGLELTRELSPGLHRDESELEALQLITAPLNATRGYADQELETTLRRSIDLSRTLERPDIQLAATIGLWASSFVQGDIVGSYDLAVQAEALVPAVPELAGQVHFGLGGSTLSLGRPDVAVHHLDLAYDLSIGAVSLTVGSRPEVHARAWSAHGWWLLGDDRRCRDARDESLQRAREVDHPYTLAVALAYAAVTDQLRGDRDQLESSCTELTALCRRHGFAYYREWAVVLSGWLRGGEAGLLQMQTGLAHLKADRSRSRLPYWLCLLAEVQRSAGHDSAARATLDAARVSAVLRQDSWWLPEVLRVRGLLDNGPVALRLLREAEALATSQSSPSLAVRARTSLAELAGT